MFFKEYRKRKWELEKLKAEVTIDVWRKLSMENVYIVEAIIETRQRLAKAEYMLQLLSK